MCGRRPSLSISPPKRRQLRRPKPLLPNRRPRRRNLLLPNRQPRRPKPLLLNRRLRRRNLLLLNRRPRRPNLLLPNRQSFRRKCPRRNPLRRAKRLSDPYSLYSLSAADFFGGIFRFHVGEIDILPVIVYNEAMLIKPVLHGQNSLNHQPRRQSNGRFTQSGIHASGKRRRCLL